MKIFSLVSEMVHNPVFAGIFGSVALGSLVYTLKALPARAWTQFVKYFSVDLTLTSNDQAFYWVNQWLATHSYSRKARTLRLDYGGETDYEFAPGIGFHWMWHKGLVFISRQMQEEKMGGMGSRDREVLHIRTIGRSQERMRAFIADAHTEANRRWQDKIKLGTFHFNYWQVETLRLKKRNMGTVFLPPGQREELVSDVKWFMENEKWFRDRGIPYRQGFLFHGPPGTGKTTLVAALAGHFDRVICILNPTVMSSDEELLSAFRSLPEKSVLLIEDVDCIQAASKREEQPDQVTKTEESESVSSPSQIINTPQKEKPKITLSGLLNAIDGVMTAEGHILVMTTNHPEKLDPALVREGRINKWWKIDNMVPEAVDDMVKCFFPNRPELWADISADARTGAPRTPAYWQARFMDIHAKASQGATDGA